MSQPTFASLSQPSPVRSVGPPQTPEDRQRLVERNMSFFSQPQVRAALMQFGLSMLTPSGGGYGATAARAIGDAAGAVGRYDQQSEERSTRQRQEMVQQRQLEQQDRQIAQQDQQLADTRAYRSGDLAVREGTLALNRDIFNAEQGNAGYDMDLLQLAADLKIAADESGVMIRDYVPRTLDEHYADVLALVGQGTGSGLPPTGGSAFGDEPLVIGPAQLAWLKDKGYTDEQLAELANDPGVIFEDGGTQGGDIPGATPGTIQGTVNPVNPPRENPDTRNISSRVTVPGPRGMGTRQFDRPTEQTVTPGLVRDIRGRTVRESTANATPPPSLPSTQNAPTSQNMSRAAGGMEFPQNPADLNTAQWNQILKNEALLFKAIDLYGGDYVRQVVRQIYSARLR